MSTWCVITGQLKNNELFEQALAPLVRLRDEGRIDGIVMSAWNEDLNTNPSLSAYASKYKLEVVASANPGIELFPGSPLKSSMGPQTIALRQALRMLDDDDLVLKTRFDLIIGETFLRRLLHRQATEDLSTPQGSPFKRKVWVPWADFVLPFLLADETFMGRAGDLSLLATDFYKQYRPGAKAHPHVESVHVLRWLPPFETGAFHDFFPNWLYLQHELPGLPRGWSDYMLAKFHTKAWWLLMAKWVSILCDNFIVDGGGRHEIVFFTNSSQITNDKFPTTICHLYPGTGIPHEMEPHAFAPNFVKARARTLILNDMEWLRNLRAGKIHGEVFYDNVVLPSFAEVASLEAQGLRPNLGPAVLDTLKHTSAGVFDPAPLQDPEWQIHRVRPGEEEGGATLSRRHA